MFMSRIKTLSARDWYWLNPRKKNYREHSNIKCLYQSIDWLSQPQCMKNGCSTAALSKNWTHVAQCFAICLNHWAVLTSLYNYKYKFCYILQPWTKFCMQDCRSWIAQEYEGQTFPEFLNTNLFYICLESKEFLVSHVVFYEAYPQQDYNSCYLSLVPSIFERLFPVCLRSMEETCDVCSSPVRAAAVLPAW